MWRTGQHWSWRTGIAIAALLGALFVVACGPEAGRTRNGGLGGSSRPAAPPTQTTNPELAVPATMNIPYATSGPLPTLPAVAPATPGFGVPTTTPVGTFAVPTPGASGATPTR